MNRRDQILVTANSVQYLPPYRIELLRVLSNPDLSTATITRAIECDPALTANVLRLANSAYFGFARSVASVADAVWRLGTRTLSQLVLASIVSTTQKQAVRGYDLPPGDMLRHSLGVAVGAEKLRCALNLPPCDHLFSAGILHDIGKIVLATFVEVDAQPILDLANRHKLSFVDSERVVLGIDHAEVGAFLAEKWNLPPDLVEIVRWHHEPEKFGSTNLAGELVHIADMLCITGGLGTGTDGLRYRSSAEVTARIGMTEHLAEQIMVAILTGIKDLEGSFGDEREALM